MAQLNAVPFVNYAKTVLAQTKANPSWLRHCNGTAEIPGTASAGAISVPIITTPTVVNPTDGTPLTNGANRTLAALTLTDAVIAAVLAEEELAQWTPDTADAWFAACGDAIINAAETAVLTAFMAGTPFATVSLTAGQQNFYDDATDGEIRDNIRKLTQAIATVQGVTGQQSPDNYAIVLPATATPTTNGSSWGNMFSALKVGGGLLWDGTLNAYRYAGIPIYGAYSSATGWGKWDGGTAGIVFHRDAMACVFPRVRVTPPRDNDSGFVQSEVKAAYGYGLINTGGTSGTWVEITNAAT